MRAPKPRSPARTRNLRALFATVTLALVVLVCAGIQAVADWVAAPHQAAISTEALDAAHAAAPAPQASGFPLALVAVLALAVGVRLVFRARAAGSKVMYWDDLPW